MRECRVVSENANSNSGRANSRRVDCRRFCRVLAVVATVGLLSFAARAETLKIGGTGGDLGTMKILGEAFMRQAPGSQVDVLPSLGSGGGIRAVLAGAIDLAISSRPLEEKERQAGAREIAYAKTAMALVTSLRPRPSGVSRAELTAIYSGEKTRWPNGEKVRPVIRPRSDTDHAIVVAALPELAEPMEIARATGAAVGNSDQDTAGLLEVVDGSLGFIGLSLVKSERRALAVLPLDGVAPTPETVRDGLYPVGKTFYLVTGRTPTAMAEQFIRFVASDAGGAILREVGSLPLARP